MKNQLDDFREQIDSIDNQIIGLLAERFTVVKKIGKWKKEKNLPPLDKNRWQKVLINRVKKAKELGISSKLIKKIYQAIHDYALEIEKSL